MRRGLIALMVVALLAAATADEPAPPKPPTVVCYDVVDYERRVVIVICIDKMKELDDEEPKHEL